MVESAQFRTSGKFGTSRAFATPTDTTPPTITVGPLSDPALPGVDTVTGTVQDADLLSGSIGAGTNAVVSFEATSPTEFTFFASEKNVGSLFLHRVGH
jgi:hypothetical protein